MMDALTTGIAERVAQERRGHDWSIADLAERSGVSAAMISRIERGEANPTAVLLSRLASAFGRSLSGLLEGVDGPPRRLLRRADQGQWRDPESGYVRRALSARPGGPLDLVEVSFPPGARIDYPRSVYLRLHQQVWILEGRLRLIEDETVHVLETGDAFTFGEADYGFENPYADTCRYLVAVAPR